MSLQGLPPILPSSQARSSDQDLALHLNQRVSAEVVQMNGDRVLLAINGIQIVARLSNPDQAALINDRRLAQFVVRDANPNQLVFELLRGGSQTLAPVIVQGANPGRLIAQLLYSMGLEDNLENTWLAGALLSQNHEVTPEKMQQLRLVLDALPQWGEEDASAAAALKTAGLPATQDAIDLLKNSGRDLKDAVASLLQHLSEALARGASNPAQMQNLSSAAQLLQRLCINWTGQPVALAENIRLALAGQGTSVEAFLKNDQPAAADSLHYQLMQLSQALKDSGPASIQREVESLVVRLVAGQLINAHPDTEPPGGYYLRFNLPLHHPNASAGQEQWAPAQIKISYRNEGQSRRVDPQHMSFRLSVELEPGKAVEVGLALVRGQIGLDITSTTPQLKDLAQDELPGLTIRLSELGYQVRTVKNQLGAVELAPPMDWGPPARRQLEGIDLEI